MPTFPLGHSTQALNAKNADLLHKLSGHTATSPTKVNWYVTAGNEATLRGIPAIGRGVAGHIPGTRPDQGCQ